MHLTFLLQVITRLLKNCEEADKNDVLRVSYVCQMHYILQGRTRSQSVLYPVVK